MQRFSICFTQKVNCFSHGTTPIVSRKQRVFEHVASWKGLVWLQHSREIKEAASCVSSKKNSFLLCSTDSSRKKKDWLGGIMLLVDWFQGFLRDDRRDEVRRGKCVRLCIRVEGGCWGFVWSTCIRAKPKVCQPQTWINHFDMGLWSTLTALQAPWAVKKNPTWLFFLSFFSDRNETHSSQSQRERMFLFI